MIARYIPFTALYFLSTALHAQQLSYIPDIVIGNRSHSYLHQVNYTINPSLRINNLTLFDTEYNRNKNNIFFIRNTISYSISNTIGISAASGIKNPGSFVTLSAQYKITKPLYSFIYSLGTTYQKGYSLEQSVSFEYSPYLTKTLQGYFTVLAIADINHAGYQRGIQQFRIGVKKHTLRYGLALNFDQFNNNAKTLHNIGLFIKYNFNT